jgi:hypothetical protein
VPHPSRSLPYDASYPGEALPLINVEFRQASGSPGVVLDRVIPNTGADASVLPWVDCQLLQLAPVLGVQGLIGGVAGPVCAPTSTRSRISCEGSERQNQSLTPWLRRSGPEIASSDSRSAVHNPTAAGLYSLEKDPRNCVTLRHSLVPLGLTSRNSGRNCVTLRHSLMAQGLTSRNRFRSRHDGPARPVLPVKMER